MRVVKNRIGSELLIATSNPGKIAEIRDLLREQPWKVLEPADLNLDVHVQETGSDYAENAAIKARAWAEASGCLVLADDSGLEVKALNGEPGLHSARYAGPDRTDAERRLFLLTKLEGYPRPWHARFVACAAAASPDGWLETVFGSCEGEIVPEERGTMGFGYDPIFQVEGTGKTMAELTMHEKNRISHRAHAVLAVIPALKRKML